MNIPGEACYDLTGKAHDLGPGGALAERPRIGWIGFQDHGLPISFRNIRIRTPSSRSGSTTSEGPEPKSEKSD